MKYFLFAYDLKIFMSEEVFFKVLSLREFRAPKNSAFLFIFLFICLLIVSKTEIIYCERQNY